ncbi:MerR family transcriptional regulator [Listeria ivanovii]|uniref:MerR family transcriptional regulator n=1 Tax=Listeria ivanovii subsp. londoniensis TaxID=202752 RepID=A0ABS1G379_LISIV|nr:MerR family transcriptional regulator [Listeria ivanovii]AIS59033.1 MerR family transcriptional regulator [Listeria ivanovii subsp. londoniensis]AIS61838.1 MerR family transcriptional regulator [Listeria ivanovii subsp. londoniensis]MBC2254691.1 MerR family transcriptional regulator [Listeria ivanovii]MBK1961106.1 MerR family transcriptional regulator [Listeria ivanovii subsp. londoniensis]MBK1967658.1 MerR family transcriptional regulator [Listeria ivanovii subsp. londoniensis]
MNIKEAAKITGLTNDTIRYYERIGIIMPIPRQANGLRDFNERSINQLKFAKTMRSAGMGVESLREYVAMIYENDDSTILARKALLTEQAELMQEKIDEMQEAHDYLLYKVENYEGHMREAEKKL